MHEDDLSNARARGNSKIFCTKQIRGDIAGIVAAQGNGQGIEISNSKAPTRQIHRGTLVLALNARIRVGSGLGEPRSRLRLPDERVFMPDSNHLAQERALELLGELHPLATQLGTPSDLASLTPASGLHFDAVTCLSSLRLFLESYAAQALAPVDLPAIAQACVHAQHYELRELIALDLALSRDSLTAQFGKASRCVGRSQLRRLRPLRDQRLVQRYLDAVHEGEAPANHTVVYGLILSVYSIPLRQGLIHYAQQTLGGFIQAAMRSLRLTVAEADALLDALSQDLPRAVDKVLQNTGRLAGPEFLPPRLDGPAR
jgi:urease accessory protein UreF